MALSSIAYPNMLKYANLEKNMSRHSLHKQMEKNLRKMKKQD
jgi:hypothetical protein